MVARALKATLRLKSASARRASPRQRSSGSAAIGFRRTSRASSDLGALIGEVMSHIHRRSAGDTLTMLNDAGLTMAQLVALHVLQHVGPSTVSAVANCLRLSPAATSHLIDRLVGQGLVGRVEDPVDRRQKRVTIAAAGRRLIDRVQRERTREMSEVVARLSPELRKQFGQVLGRVIEELSSLPQEMP